MSNGINRSNVVVDFKDIYGATISDDVEIKVYNTQVLSLKQVFDVSFRGDPVTLSDVPAFPTGHAQMIVTPTKYRFKQRFINVEAGKDNHITEYFFVDPAHANPHPIAYEDLANSVGRERQERVSQLASCGEGRMKSRRPVNRSPAHLS